MPDNVHLKSLLGADESSGRATVMHGSNAVMWSVPQSRQLPLVMQERHVSEGATYKIEHIACQQILHQEEAEILCNTHLTGTANTLVCCIESASTCRPLTSI